jgi:isopentenyl diphosphate isomerase/L-lactate dehydrogenase-like FMN-dependent dehydrogenase
MHELTVNGAAIRPPAKNANFLKYQRRFPTIQYLRRGAQRRLPHFAYEYGDGGAGADNCIKHNWAALDAVQLVPRYGVIPKLPPVDVMLFGRRYAAPVGVAPMGAPVVVWPGADKALARAAQRACVPYTLGTVGGATIEEIAKIAPDVFWFQLYRFAENDHAISFNLVKRAQAAGAHVLMLTLDSPVRTTRPREVVVGMAGGGVFRPDLSMIAGILTSPGWALAMLRNGRPRFANIQPYAGSGSSLNETIRFARKQMDGTFSWEEVARYRDRWKGPLVLKGILHPADAEKAVALGADGILVSNHGGRQIELLPPSIDCLPAIVKATGSRATVLMDSGIRSGVDVARALALGASAALVGKAFLWGLGALGNDGPGHVIDLLIDELQSSLSQIGAHSPEEARNVVIRHPGALHF